MASCSGIGIKEIGSTKVYLKGTVTGLTSSKRYCLHHYWGGWQNLPRSSLDYTYISGVTSFDLGSVGCYVPKNKTVEGQQFEVRLHEVERTCESIIREACSKVLWYEVTVQRYVHFYVRDDNGNPVNNARIECAGEAVYTGSDGKTYLVLDTEATYYAYAYAPSGYECTECSESFYHDSDRVINFYMKKTPTTGTLQVRVYDGSTNAYLYGVAVYVDGAYKGTTLGYTGLIIPGVSIGFHTVLLVKSGYADKIIQTYVDANGTVLNEGLTLETALVDVRVVDQDSEPVAGSMVTIPNALGATTIATNLSGVAVGFTLARGDPFTATAAPPTGYTSDSGSTGSFTATQSVTINLTLTKTPITGMLAIGSRPHDAKIYINNEYRGITPYPSSPFEQYYNIELPVGLYAVKLTLDGYKDETADLRVNTGETTYYSPVLEAATGDVYVTAEDDEGNAVVGAEIYVDGVATGVLTPGTVTVSAESHEIYTEKDV
jgi:hypothetical protein